MKARMCFFVIRKQRDEHVRNGRPKKWIAACQNCGRACSSLSHAEVLAWADGHLRDRKRHPHVPSPMTSRLDAITVVTQFTQGVARALERSRKQHNYTLWS